MQGYASCTVAGNLTRDPETKTFESGSSITEFGIAVNTQRKQGDEYVEVVSFFDIAVWGGFGELCARKLRKGDAASILGTLEQQSWETSEGEKRSKVRIIGRQIVSEGFFRSKDEDNVPGEAAPAAEAAPAEEKAAPAAAAADDDIPF